MQLIGISWKKYFSCSSSKRKFALLLSSTVHLMKTELYHLMKPLGKMWLHRERYCVICLPSRCSERSQWSRAGRRHHGAQHPTQVSTAYVYSLVPRLYLGNKAVVYRHGEKRSGFSTRVPGIAYVPIVHVPDSGIQCDH